MKNFKLKKGVAPFRVFGSTLIISDDTITDQIAIQVIKRFPEMEDKFTFDKGTVAYGETGNTGRPRGGNAEVKPEVEAVEVEVEVKTSMKPKDAIKRKRKRK